MPRIHPVRGHQSQINISRIKLNIVSASNQIPSQVLTEVIIPWRLVYKVHPTIRPNLKKTPTSATVANVASPL